MRMWFKWLQKYQLNTGFRFTGQLSRTNDNTKRKQRDNECKGRKCETKRHENAIKCWMIHIPFDIWHVSFWANHVNQEDIIIVSLPNASTENECEQMRENAQPNWALHKLAGDTATEIQCQLYQGSFCIEIVLWQPKGNDRLIRTNPNGMFWRIQKHVTVCAMRRCFYMDVRCARSEKCQGDGITSVAITEQLRNGEQTHIMSLPNKCRFSSCSNDCAIAYEMCYYVFDAFGFGLAGNHICVRKFFYYCLPLSAPVYGYNFEQF